MTVHPTIVPDASVLLKWVLESKDEGDRDRALQIREAWLSDLFTIVLPSLWIFEAGNILGLKQPNLSASLMRILINYGFEEASPADFYEKAFELMKTFKVTFYDAAYHAVAIKRSGTMITADEAYYKKTSRTGHVAVLGKWFSQLGGTASAPAG